tara:strand:+ start:210 stop:395 length:186 start_codon:yes stop_codon:yes gene_type:complete
MILENLQRILNELHSEDNIKDAGKAESGNAAAGRRLRKACLEAVKELKTLRASILEQTRKN